MTTQGMDAVARLGFGSKFSRLSLVFVCACACTVLVLEPVLGMGAIGFFVGFFLLLYLLATTLKGKVEPTILLWVLLFPLGYSFASFPVERSIITLDRVVPVALLLTMALATPGSSERVPQNLRKCAIAWAVFLAVAGISILRESELLVALRRFLDGFCLPGILGWCVVRNFDVRRNLPALHTMASLMAIYVAGIGLAEMILRRDLLPLPGTTIFFAGALPRPNGPFYSNDSFALIGLITLFLLVFLRKALGEQISWWRKTLHGLGVAASLGMAVMPMFRSVLITLMVILLLSTLSARTFNRRVAGFVLLFFCVGSVSLLSVLAPDAYEDRSRPDNYYVRLAEQLQTLQVFLSHPILGVGLGNFTDVVEKETRFAAFYKGIQSIDSPHNNLGAVLAETGILGFLPYVAAQVWLIAAFRKVRERATPESQLVWTYFLYIFLSYWINGLTLASGYNSDLNFWFILSVTVLYKYSMTEEVESWQFAGHHRLVPEYGYA